MVDSELITFKDVKKRFGKEEVLSSVNLEIPENKVTCIVGASGEGKTTILKLLIGFYKPSKGKVFYLRDNIFKKARKVERDFGFASEDCSFYDNLTVKENLTYFGRLHHLKGKVIRERIKELTKFVSLYDALDTLAENLSIGMKKRLEIACSMIHNPKILVMDEPTADLDPLLRKDILDLIKKIRNEDTTIIMTTQILNEVEDICDKLAVLADKEIKEEGNPSSIKQKYGKNDFNGVFEEIFSERLQKRKENIDEKEKKNSKEKSRGMSGKIKNASSNLNFIGKMKEKRKKK